MLPLYKRYDGNKLLKIHEQDPNPGLQFNKFPQGGESTWHAPLSDGTKKGFFQKFAQAEYGYLKNRLHAYLDRQQALVSHLSPKKPVLLHVKTDWRFVSGLGSGHPYETGFIWHRTLGVPYLPGSSVKGMIRAWAEQWCDDEDCDNETVCRLFGSDTDGTDSSDKAGNLIVFDALPINPPTLELDILNPHYQPYYENNKKNPPADYYNPVPVFFLTVAPNQPFRFCLAPRPGASSDDAAGDLSIGHKLLEDALETIGAGGKTAVGYGVMVSPEKRAKQWLETTLVELRHDRDFKGQPEENLWKKTLAEKWISAPSDLKPVICDLIKKKWTSLGLDWANPVGGSAKQAKRILTTHR